MNYLNKIPAQTALSSKTKLDLSCDHVTTMQFMKMQPVYYRHMLKGEHINFNVLANIRPAPMAVPSYGRIRCNLRGFFVPYRLVFPKWSDFVSASSTYSSRNEKIIQY